MVDGPRPVAAVTVAVVQRSPGRKRGTLRHPIPCPSPRGGRAVRISRSCSLPFLVRSSGCVEPEVRPRRIERDAELARVAAHLREQEPALDAGHRRAREFCRFGVAAELAAGLHPDEAVAEMGFPAVEAGGDRRPGAGVLFCELAGERADRAAAACLPVDLELDERVEPAVDAGPGVEVVEEVALEVDDGVGRDVDDGADEVIAVLEVVVELAATGARARADVVEAHAGRAFFGDELGCGLEDPLPGRTPLRGRRCLGPCHGEIVALLDLTVHLFYLDCLVQTGGVACTSWWESERSSRAERPGSGAPQQSCLPVRARTC